MEKKKYTIKQIITYSIFIIGIIALGILVERKKEENNKEKIDNGARIAYGIIEKLRPNVSKNMTYKRRKDVLYLYYIKNDTIFHIIEDLPDGQIEKLGIKQNDCYLVRIAKSDSDIFDIDLTKKIDTLIDKTHFEHHVYQTNIHKNIIE